MVSEDFKLNLYFKLYKDYPMGSRDYFRWEFTRKNGYYKYLPELIHMIETYQKKKYGSTIWYSKSLYAPGKKGTVER